MAAESSKSSSSADSYIGSLISLTSKSEIRYEGVLYSINTEESSIGLRNVRSFGSEGRKKDGPQIPPSDRVYEFILFRGTDIKDLQVKSTPPAQTASTIDNDPAIIQSHYPRPPAPSTNMPPAVSVSPADVNSHTPQMGHPGSNFSGGMPLYHHGASLGSWGPSLPSSINGNPLPMPAYWPGMYGPPNTLPHLHQQTYRPPPGLSVPPSLLQPIPYPGLSAPPQAAAPNVASSSSLPTTSNNFAMIGFNPPPPGGALNVPNSSSLLLAASNISTAGTSSSLSLPVVPSLQQPLPYSGFIPAQGATLNVPSSSFMPFTTISSSAILGLNTPPAAGSLNVPSSSSPFLAASSSSTALTSSSLSSLSLPAVPSLTAASERSSSSVFNKGLVSVLPSESLNAGLPTLASLTISDSESINPPVSSKVNTVSSSTLPYQNLSQPVSSSTPIEKEMLIPSLVTPDQILQAEQSHISSEPSQIAHKDVKVVEVSSSSEKSVSVLKEKEVRPPILPLPPAPRPYQKPNGATQVRHNYRGGGRGRGTGASRPVTRFTEDFDFTAMNEKFNKDEVWGHLGKSNKIHSQDKEGDEDDEDGYEDEDGTELPKIEAKPVYNKDDFFDSLSSNALGNEQQNARPKFSEQMKIDTETFGEFARYRGGRGGRGGRGTRHGGRGPNYGRGNGYAGSGGGYGYAGRGRGRGRGRALSSQAS